MGQLGIVTLTTLEMTKQLMYLAAKAQTITYTERLNWEHFQAERSLADNHSGKYIRTGYLDREAEAAATERKVEDSILSKTDL